MSSVTFLLKDDPFTLEAGDTHISRLMIETAAESNSVRALILSADGRVSEDAPIPTQGVVAPPRSLLSALRAGLTSRRSLLHGYFRIPALTDAIRADESEVLVAEHTYMAESAIDADRDDASLLINTHALQSSVLAQRRSPPGLARLEARRTWRDELRCVWSAD